MAGIGWAPLGGEWWTWQWCWCSFYLMVPRCGAQSHPPRTAHRWLSVGHWLCLTTKGRSPNPKAQQCDGCPAALPTLLTYP
jgi:hypothetical protein